MVDAQLVQDYKSADLEIWAWSYNYVGNDSLQAEALYLAARSGYEGYVIDVEMEFDGRPLALFNLFFAFDQARSRAIADGLIDESFQVYCTTWGNPRDHNYSIDVIDPYVDGFMPQTYVEQWGLGFINNISFWIDRGNREYRELGATKPIHHIIAAQNGNLTSDNINEFFASSGPESSLWRVPGGGIPFSLWDTWVDIDWEMDFCEPVSTASNSSPTTYKLYPNPVIDIVYIEGIAAGPVVIYDAIGNILTTRSYTPNKVDLSDLSAGLYYLYFPGDEHRFRVIKQ